MYKENSGQLKNIGGEIKHSNKFLKTYVNLYILLKLYKKLKKLHG